MESAPFVPDDIYSDETTENLLVGIAHVPVPGELFISGWWAPLENVFDLVVAIGPPKYAIYDYLSMSTVYYEIPDENTAAAKDAMSKVADLICIRVKKSLDANERVLVHCYAGVSRSATVVLHYMMNYAFPEKRTLDACFAALQSVRPCINPEHVFIDFLQGK